ncbi:MAG: ABC transporter permease, partial [Oscillospiraceae bacterium]|nr:ABC transporter permease [Oscillospiraceae bacterium]
GMKPGPYLLGIGSVTFFLSIFSSVAFGFIAGFGGQNFWLFVASLLSGVAASIFLGATIGILCNSQAAATGLSMPAAMLFGFGPMLAGFNENIARVLHPLYTQQLNVIADYLTHGGGTTPLWQSFAIIWANVAVLGVLFAVVYAKKGLKG